MKIGIHEPTGLDRNILQNNCDLLFSNMFISTTLLKWNCLQKSNTSEGRVRTWLRGGGAAWTLPAQPTSLVSLSKDQQWARSLGFPEGPTNMMLIKPSFGPASPIHVPSDQRPSHPSLGNTPQIAEPLFLKMFSVRLFMVAEICKQLKRNSSRDIYTAK